MALCAGLPALSLKTSPRRLLHLARQRGAAGWATKLLGRSQRHRGLKQRTWSMLGHVSRQIAGRSGADREDSAPIAGKDAAGRSSPKKSAGAAGRTGFGILQQSWCRMMSNATRCSVLHLQAFSFSEYLGHSRNVL